MILKIPWETFREKEKETSNERDTNITALRALVPYVSLNTGRNSLTTIYICFLHFLPPPPPPTDYINNLCKFWLKYKIESEYREKQPQDEGIHIRQHIAFLISYSHNFIRLIFYSYLQHSESWEGYKISINQICKDCGLTYSY